MEATGSASGADGAVVYRAVGCEVCGGKGYKGRMGIYELAHRPDVPTGAVISEAVELAKRYSTDDSGKFVNGMLSRIAEEVRSDDHAP